MALIGQINGVQGLADMLKALPQKVKQDEVLAHALKQAGGVLRDQAEANLIANGSVDTGLLSRTVMVVQNKETVPGLIEVVVKPSTKLSTVARKGRHKATRARPSKYAHFIEFGTQHSAAKPFMRPALDSKGPEAVRLIEGEVQSGVAAAAHNLGLAIK